MKNTILTLSAIAAIGLMVLGAKINETGEACRASMVEGKSMLVAVPLLKMADQKAPLMATLTMENNDVPMSLRIFVRPGLEAAAYCEMAEKGGK